MASDEPDDNEEAPEFEYDNSKSLKLNSQSDEAEETDFNVQELFETVTDLVQAKSPWSKLITPEKLLTDDSLYSEPKLYKNLTTSFLQFLDSKIQTNCSESSSQQTP